MTGGRLILRSLAFYRRQHAGVALGVAIATAVITGALLVGDSVRHTLRQAALARLGSTQRAMQTGDRFFLVDHADANAAKVLQLQAVAVTPDLSGRANNVQLLGIDSGFADLLGDPAPPASDTVVLNDALAAQLNASVGDTIVLRLRKPSGLAANLPVGFEEDADTIALRVRVASVTSDRFSLRAEPGAAANAYVSREWLAERIAMVGRANLLLTGDEVDSVGHWALEDAQLELHVDGDALELRTPRVFIDEAVTTSLDDLPGRRILTYFVNKIARGEQATPYSMVTAMSDELADDEVALNQWLADDLGAAVGARVTLTYFVADEGRKLVENSAEFTVKHVVPIEGEYADRTLVPDFPGLEGVSRISDWDGGPMIDRSRIRQKDEDYWDAHRATPKAFISLAAGHRLWSNRYGTLTSIRFDPGVTETDVRSRFDPATVGFVARDVRDEAMDASRATVDFGGLFLGLSFFIIVAAVLLTALLFAFGVEQRANQVGMMAAVGLPVKQVRRLLLVEGGVVALAGSVVGIVGGVGYTKAVLAVLSGAWSGAVAGTPVYFHATPGSLAIGFVSGLVVAVLAMAWSLWLVRRASIRAMLNGTWGNVARRAARRPIVTSVFAGLLVVGAVALAMGGDFGDPMATAGAFFGVGAMLMIAGLCAAYAWLAMLSRAARRAMSYRGLAMRNATRRRGRSLAVVALLASGVFLVIAIAGFRQATPRDPTVRHSGTGGFTMIAESTLPLLYDPTMPVGAEQYGFDAPLPGVVMRASNGDDASCLNLNQVPQPRVLGVRPNALAQRDAFVVNDPQGWRVLDQSFDDGAIPAIADANTAQWALKLKVGDAITLVGSRGEPMKVRLVATIANSILQGNLIVAEDRFADVFPDAAGYRVVLIDGSVERIDDLRAELTQALSDEGVAVSETAQRLASFNAVQNTYLSIFQALGALGVVLGTAGLGVVVLRNLLERRRELAMLRAVGFEKVQLLRMVFFEHVTLLLVGLGIGVVSAVVAVWPSTGGDILRHIQWPVAIVGGLGALWVQLAGLAAIRGDLLAGLRKE